MVTDGGVRKRLRQCGAVTRHRAAAGVLACATVLTSCSNSASASLEGPLLISEGSWNAGMAASVGGELAWVGRCVGVGETVVVWPKGVSWDEEQESLVLADGTSVAVGEDVSGGGGSMETAAVNSLFGSDAAQALRECGVEVGAQVVVFDVGSDVTAGPAS